MATVAIETVYRGCRFRSRIEARWAVFMTTLGVEWEYEKEGFDLGGDGLYLPDFYLPGIRGGAWLEVKGEKPTRSEEEKCAALAKASGKDVLLVWRDIPAIDDVYGSGPVYRQPDEYPMQFYDSRGTADIHYCWCICNACGTVGIEYDARSARIGCHNLDSDKAYTGDHRRILAAYQRARSARFEHGERG